MILADLQDGKRDWKRDTRTYSFTSGPRSPTKMEYSGPRSSLVERSVSNCRVMASERGLKEAAKGEKAEPVEVVAMARRGFDGWRINQAGVDAFERESKRDARWMAAANTEYTRRASKVKKARGSKNN